MSKKILIADDDEAIRDIIRKTLELEEARFEIYEAQSGNIALEMARIIKPQLILLDVMMPGMSGYEVCRALKGSSDTRNIYVLFLTGRRSEAALRTIKNSGGDDFLTKPFGLTELREKVKNFMSSA